MSRFHPLLLSLPLAAAIAGASSPARAQLTTPASAAPQVRTLGPQERAVVDGLAPVPHADLNLRPSATVQISAHGKATNKSAVQRSNLGVQAAVYAGAPYATASQLPLRPGERSPRPLNFQEVGDSAEAWATMTAQGVPYLRLRGFGDSRTDATAAWTSRFTLGGSTSKEVVLRFVVPPTLVGGNTEMQAPAWWRARMRTDVLVNGFPAWSTEAWRLRADYKVASNQGGTSTQPLAVLQTFGEPMPFTTNDEDTSPLAGGPANDSDAGSVDIPSHGKLVYLSLGRYNPGQAIELMMVVRGSAYTEPSPGQSTDHRCRPNEVDGGFFCSRASMQVDGSQADAPQIILLP